jgi:hypothetical protein
VYLEYKKGGDIVGESLARKAWSKVRWVARMTLRVYWGTFDGSVVD